MYSKSRRQIHTFFHDFVSSTSKVPGKYWESTRKTLGKYTKGTNNAPRNIWEVQGKYQESIIKFKESIGQVPDSISKGLGTFRESTAKVIRK